SGRRRHTRLVSDWSSDVCSSDLGAATGTSAMIAPAQEEQVDREQHADPDHRARAGGRANHRTEGKEVREECHDVEDEQCEGDARSEERRGGKEGGARARGWEWRD